MFPQSTTVCYGEFVRDGTVPVLRCKKTAHSLMNSISKSETIVGNCRPGKYFQYRPNAANNKDSSNIKPGLR